MRRIRNRVLLFAIAIFAAALPVRPSAAFELAGTAELEVLFPDSTDGDIAVRSLGGFNLVPSPGTGGSTLVGFIEFGPANTTRGPHDLAGQLAIEIEVGNSPTVDVELEWDSPYLLARYEEWRPNLETSFAGHPSGGWVDAVAHLDEDRPTAVDIAFRLDFIDPDTGEARTLDGALSGGWASPAPAPSPRRRADTEVRYVDDGCHSHYTEVYVYPDPYYYDDPYVDDSGCGGDDLDSGESDSGGCDSDDGGSRNETVSDDACEGDDLKSGFGLPPMPQLVKRLFWVPVLLVMLARRRA